MRTGIAGGLDDVLTTSGLVTNRQETNRVKVPGSIPYEMFSSMDPANNSVFWATSPEGSQSTPHPTLTDLSPHIL
jgi:hypothetical protein